MVGGWGSRSHKAAYLHEQWWPGSCCCHYRPENPRIQRRPEQHRLGQELLRREPGLGQSKKLHGTVASSASRKLSSNVLPSGGFDRRKTIPSGETIERKRGASLQCESTKVEGLCRN